MEKNEEVKKVKFETKMRQGKNGKIETAIFIDSDKLHWSIDTTILIDAFKMGPEYLKAVQKEVEKHFIESVSEFLDRKVTYDEIKTAIKTGWI